MDGRNGRNGPEIIIIQHIKLSKSLSGGRSQIENSGADCVSEREIISSADAFTETKGGGWEAFPGARSGASSGARSGARSGAGSGAGSTAARVCSASEPRWSGWVWGGGAALDGYWSSGLLHHFHHQVYCFNKPLCLHIIYSNALIQALLLPVCLMSE